MPGVDAFFASAAARTPDAVAVRWAGEAWSYRDLNERANRLAHRLLSEGVGPGDRIGICLDRGLHLPLAVLAVLKAGAAYVPLDPSYPATRLGWMADDSDARLVVASLECADLVGAPGRVRVIEELLAESGSTIEDPRRPHGPSSPAYLIYTSGSTGRPKGVVMPHGALSNLVAWQVAQPGFTGPARAAQLTPLSFDVHFQEMFATWAVGGELVLVADAVRRDAPRLLRFLIEEDIERIFLPFVALQQLADVAVTHGPLPASLRDVVTAGEQLQVTASLVELFERLPGCRLHNQYGPSEGHVVTSHTLAGPPSAWPVLPPIGKPIDGVRIHIVDGSLEPVPAGDVGELCIAGAALATGYWDRDDLTRERFVEGVGNESRVYRTGDLARRGEDGVIEFLGRADGQTKIRGYRVEVGEVEAAIAEHAAVRECAVVATGRLATERKLVAYLVLDGSAVGARVREPLARTRLGQWRDIWDGTYAQGVEPEDPELDLTGWTDSFTGRPFRTSDMRVWLDGAVGRVLAGEPSRILEIGCGTGLLLHRVAPHCQLYHAIDVSAVAIDALRRAVEARPPGAEVTLEVRAADEIDGLRDREFDCVVMSGVTQYFPDVEHLLDVLVKACGLVEHGRVFIGDVTDATLREAFVTALEGARARPDGPLEALRARIEKRLAEDPELAIDPDLFRLLPGRVPSIGRVEVQLKPGRYDNELGKYRYDVILHLDGTGPGKPGGPAEWLKWSRTRPTPDELAAQAAATGVPVGLRGIPNARVAREVAAAAALRAGTFDTVGAWREAVAAAAGDEMDPQDFWNLEGDGIVAVDVFRSEDPSRFDVWVHPGPPRGAVGAPSRAEGDAWSRMASQPLGVALMPHVVGDLRERLAKSLPDYMLPARYVLLARLPTTASGKLDRRALPAPSGERPPLEQEYAAPRGDTEAALTALWADLLELDRVGVNDNFFDLGGNSILGVRLCLRVREQLARELPVIAVFEHPTVRALAAHLDGDPGQRRDLKRDVEDRARKQADAFRRGRPFKGK